MSERTSSQSIGHASVAACNRRDAASVTPSRWRQGSRLGRRAGWKPNGLNLKDGESDLLGEGVTSADGLAENREGRAAFLDCARIVAVRSLSHTLLADLGQQAATEARLVLRGKKRRLRAG